MGYESIEASGDKCFRQIAQPKTGKEGNQLQTLGMISHESCTKDVFGQLRSLQKLGIDGGSKTLVEAKGLDTLHELEKLKLVNINCLNVVIGESQRLPFSSMLPPYLRRLTLKDTILDWKEVSNLRGLSKLEVLKLKNIVPMYRESLWEAISGFCGLQVLHIKYTNLHIWKVSANTFPILRCLRVKNCGHLEEIPFSLRKSLQILDLEGVTDSVIDSALRIKEEKRDLSLNIANTSGLRTEAPVPAGKFTTMQKPPLVELDSVVDSALRSKEELHDHSVIDSALRILRNEELRDHSVADSALRIKEAKHDLSLNMAKTSGLNPNSPVHGHAVPYPESLSRVGRAARARDFEHGDSDLILLIAKRKSLNAALG